MCVMAGLGDFPAGAVLRAEDLARAKSFYTDVLGLKPMDIQGPGDEGMFSAGQGSMILIYERPGMPAPQNTTLGFSIPPDRFDEVADALRSKGVKFEEYDLPEIGLKTTNGIAEYEGTKAAWFKDTEDNIINIVAM
jgi:catechol 2,3-dioxygenase-like lactoylglutathione lyase family enzyme